jgi:DNA polymerase III subunit gamma/tau
VGCATSFPLDRRPVSLALYRKYRSLTFADLIGQEHIAATLRNQVRRGEVAHAYLFTGIRGTGKTSSARILARAVTCLAPADGEPDNVCAACVEVLGGGAVDVLEIDAASNRGIDEMRDLREKVKFLPALLRRKVYIVDEAHMLTTEAWNAFLKTLEEPPPHVLFVLATTEPHKVPETVRSRVQRFDFRRVPTEAIAAHLGRVCALEGATADADALELVAESGQGSVRDALSVLDQALATGERPLAVTTVRRALGLADPATLRALMLGLAAGDAAAALRAAAAAFDSGADARQLLREMARLARGAELMALGYPEGAGLTSEDTAVCADMARTGRRGLWVDAIDRFAEAEINLRQPVDSRLQVELALLRLASTTVGIEERLARVEGLIGAAPGSPPLPVPPAAPVSPVPRLPVPKAPVTPARVAPPPLPPPPLSPVDAGPADAPSVRQALPPVDTAPPAPPPVSAPVPAVQPGRADPPPTPVASARAEPSVAAAAPVATAAVPPAGEAASAELAEWVEAWPAIIEALRRRDVMLAGILRDCTPLAGERDRLVIGVPYGWHLERVRDPQKAPLLAEVVRAVVGRPCTVEAEFSGDAREKPGSRASARGQASTPEAAASDEPDATSAVLAAFPGARLTGSVLRDIRTDAGA